MKNNRITPVGLKGQQINERMKELMGIKSINENQSNVVVELTKMGPDGNAYAIIRENHEWYIKKTTKTSNLIAEDFKYIGGLMNKKDEAYPSYAKAIKHLNLKFKSLAEAYNFEGEINVFENDNLISENMPSAGGFSEMKGNGFSGKGNNEGQQSMWEEDDIEMSEAKKNNPWAICTASVGRENKDKYEACVMDVKKKNGMDEAMDESMYESMYEEAYMDEVEMTEAEKAIDEMIDMGEGEEMTAKEKEFAALAEPKDKITYADKIAGAKKSEVKESKLSIFNALKNMDAIIDRLTEGEVKKKV
jgi:hypothetical protein